MKRFAASILAAVLCLSLGLTAFADSSKSFGDEQGLIGFEAPEESFSRSGTVQLSFKDVDGSAENRTLDAVDVFKEDAYFSLTNRGTETSSGFFRVFFRAFQKSGSGYKDTGSVYYLTKDPSDGAEAYLATDPESKSAIYWEKSSALPAKSGGTSFGNTLLVQPSGTVTVRLPDLGSGTIYCLTASKYYPRNERTIWMEEYLTLDTKAVENYFKPKPNEHPTVVLSNQAFTVNGIGKAAEIYNIDGNNYFKLRDLAAMLNSTTSRFSVDVDSQEKLILIQTGEPYRLVGGELKVGKDNSSTTVLSDWRLQVNGKPLEDGAVTAYNIGGNNFFKLADLAEYLNFNVAYEEDTRTVLITSK